MHQLLKQPEIQNFVNTSAFNTMLVQVAKDDDKAIPNNKNWLYNHPKEALIFSKTSIVWNTLKKVYGSSKFKELIIGKKIPEENDIFETLVFISKRIQGIDWSIKK